MSMSYEVSDCRKKLNLNSRTSQHSVDKEPFGTTSAGKLPVGIVHEDRQRRSSNWSTKGSRDI